jgi:hypothetical protein
MAITIAHALYTLVPAAQWSLKNQKDYSTIEWFSDNIPQPTAEEIQAEIVRLEVQVPLDKCKQQAKKLLADTDWALISDVSQTLANQADFIAYRAAIRGFVINPVSSPCFPTVPTAQWSS